MSGYDVLTETDLKADGKAIIEILQKYSWPTCTTADLTLYEKNELLSNIAAGEERFIQKVFNKRFGYGTYAVVFVPTTLYELFCIMFYYKTYSLNNPYQRIVKNIFALNYNDDPLNGIDLNSVFSEKNPRIARKKVYAIFNEVNNAYSAPDNTLLYLNNECIKQLFVWYPSLKKVLAPGDISKNVEHLALGVATQCIGQLKSFYSNDKYYSSAIYDLGCSHDTTLLGTVIDLEYQARKENKGILFRGSSFLNVSIRPSDTKSKKKKILGSCFMQYGDLLHGIKISYWNPYSISFGNSLFAGIFRDTGACAYYYLATCGRSGYALFIDKKDYYEHQCNNLFFIAPLTTVASLWQRGEYFHSRSKAAILKKSGARSVQGIAGSYFNDATGLLLITRDPLKHEALFGNFLAKNGHIIKFGNENDLTVPEDEFIENILAAQSETAAYYNALKVIKPCVTRYERRHKKNSLY